MQPIKVGLGDLPLVRALQQKTLKVVSGLLHLLFVLMPKHLAQAAIPLAYLPPHCHIICLGHLYIYL
jgi:hypothetical protein